MKDVTKNEIKVLLTILKNPETSYNASNIAKEIGISSMGALKILKRLERENLLHSRQLGKSIFYNFNFKNEYLIEYLTFLLNKEIEQTSSYTKRWAIELKKIKNSELIILFGSVLEKEEKATDVDVLFIINPKKIQLLKIEIEKINMLNDKRIHPIYQSERDFKDNIRNQDKIVLNALKGIIPVGQRKFVDFLKGVHK